MTGAMDSTNQKINYKKRQVHGSIRQCQSRISHILQYNNEQSSNNASQKMCNPQQTHQNPMTQDHDQEQEGGTLAIRLAHLVALPMVLKSALELNLIDTIFTAGDGAFLSPSELASQLSTKNPDAPVLLDRMLRRLASYDILKCSLRAGENGEVERSYGAGPLCKFLAKNQDGGSVADFFLLHHDKVLMESWYHLNDVILEGGVPFNRAYGMTLFEYLGIDQRFNRLFNQAMSNPSTMIMKKMLDVYKGFEGTKVLVDVGGGIGATLDAIISKYPGIKGINFDLPHVLADAPTYSGVEHVGGDMFVSVPKGDTIFMKWILHAWSDERCLILLKNCWEALPNNGKVIVVDCILPVAPENNVTSHIAYEFDLFMLAVTPGGKERTQEEFKALALKSGFRGCQVECCAYDIGVLEFHKKAEA
ncbi:Methyltransf_2 domain-containing protein/Dimerisation domain-containing protein [Cephalotus follicularis]|uniref:caffeate O-methyltransferase n=1 Tax=Cephalotus follicularis TaxID=3775 RepID=A0A1Q3BVZ1_CEPFO|nr:Methyltransf_2 domain-containing protein/Dimerisation domain-containing protein [Cephalotus follicularis]